MKILIVDSESGELLAVALRGAGFPETEFVGSAEDAVERINSLRGIDLLVTDVFLEGIDGFTLREAVQAQLTELRTIFLSAHDLSEYADRIAGSPVLGKPVAPEALVAAVHSLAAANQALSESSPVPEPSAAPSPEPQPDPQPEPTSVPTTEPPPDAPVPAAPRAVAVPNAVPTAVRASTPGTVARVAAPRAVPAVPTAVPTAVPIATAQPGSPRPVATAKPAAAAPRAVVATPKPAVAHAGVPLAKAIPAGAKVPHAPKVPGRPFRTPPADGETEDLTGRTFGLYHIEEKLAEGLSGGIYRATQTNVGRSVEFHVLNASFAADPAAVQNFVADASVKANAPHPYILAVYEAGEAEGTYYFTSEYFEGASIAQMVRSGETIDEKTALRVLKVGAEVLSHLSVNKTRRELISPDTILLGRNHAPRIRNLALHAAAEEFANSDEIARLGAVVASVLSPATKPSSGVPALLNHMQTGTFNSWASLLQEIQSIEPKVIPKEEAKINARERAAILAVEEAKKRQKRAMLWSMIGSLFLLSATLFAVWWAFLRKPVAKHFDVMVEIPAGEFIFGDGQKKSLPTFWIDQYEVTIGQYAEFLKFLEENKDQATKFDHPDQPKGKSHVPVDWADSNVIPGYYTYAQKWGNWRGGKLDLNSPVMNVDWFDAYAYAKWKGRTLPTEEQWEKAARGTDGFRYPWGNEKADKRVNSGADFNPDPKAKAEVDGWKNWAPVDAVTGDKSPFGVMGLAGNVAEWTSTMADGQERLAGTMVPVIKGGHFRKGPYEVTQRVMLLLPLQTDTVLGFRTVSASPPSAAAAKK